MRSLELETRSIGQEERVYVVAELSANHGQRLENAAEMVRAAAEAGADAIKLQTYTPDTMTIQCDGERFRVGEGSLWEGHTLYELYREAYTPWEWHPKLQRIAKSLGLDLFSAAFDPTAVDFLEEMDVPIHKVASFEIVDIPLIEHMARTGKPLVISTGMATLGEIDEAVRTARNAGARQIALLKCTSAYPAPPEEMNLRAIPHLSETFDLPVGLSDHTLGISASVAAVALGACIVEKHFTLSRDVPSPDAAFSLEPHEFKAMVDAVRVAEKALGKALYEAGKQESASRVFRRSLFVVEDIEAGEVFTNGNVRSIRPGYGLPPKFLSTVLGRVAAEDVVRGTPLAWNMIGTPRCAQHMEGEARA